MSGVSMVSPEALHQASTKWATKSGQSNFSSHTGAHGSDLDDHSRFLKDMGDDEEAENGDPEPIQS